jgi:sRNA-binding carbon storage regulator CsrA
MTEKNELIAIVLQQRIGELVANYETQIAVLRAEITEMINNNKQKAADKYSEDLLSKIADNKNDVL